MTYRIAQLLLALFFGLPGFQSGEWRCIDGGLCLTCDASEPLQRRQDDCCPATERAVLSAADCHDCCSYFGHDIPIGEKKQKASAGQEAPQASLPSGIATLSVADTAPIIHPRIPAFLWRLHAPPAAGPRAPPPFV